MHEYQRFIQSELDARGWRQSDLVRKSGLSRQLISNILRDTRENIGQMPDESTLAGIAKGFGISIERVRAAAARSLTGYSDSGEPLTLSLREVSIDALLTEIRRRVVEADHGLEDATQSDAPSEANKIEEGKPAPLNESNQGAGVVSLDKSKVPRERGRRAGPDAAARARAKRPQDGRQQG